MKFNIMVDMDGVLTDFNKKLSELLDKPVDQIEDFGNDPEIWKKIDKAGANFWSDMEWMTDGKELWGYLKKYDPTILSSPSNHKNSIEGKKIWLKENLPKIPYFIEKNKALYADTNTILIDDREKNIKKWEDAGGIGILHKNAKDTIKKLKDIRNKQKEAFYMSTIKLSAIKDVIYGYLGKEAAPVINPFTGEVVNKSPVSPITPGIKGTFGPRDPNLSGLNFVERTDKRILHGIQDLMDTPNFDNASAKRALGKILLLRGAGLDQIESKKREIQDHISKIESQDLIELLGLILKDIKSKEDVNMSERLISKIKNSLGVLSDIPKASDIFKTPSTEMVRPEVKRTRTPEEWRAQSKRLREMAHQRSTMGQREAAEMINNLVDRIDSVLKKAGLI